MMPAATITTMTNTAPIAVTHQPKTDPAKMGFITAAAAANSKQGKLHPLFWLWNRLLSLLQAEYPFFVQGAEKT